MLGIALCWLLGEIDQNPHFLKKEFIFWFSLARQPIVGEEERLKKAVLSVADVPFTLYLVIPRQLMTYNMDSSPAQPTEITGWKLPNWNTKLKLTKYFSVSLQHCLLHVALSLQVSFKDRTSSGGQEGLPKQLRLQFQCAEKPPTGTDWIHAVLFWFLKLLS